MTAVILLTNFYATYTCISIMHFSTLTGIFATAGHIHIHCKLQHLFRDRSLDGEFCILNPRPSKEATCENLSTSPNKKNTCKVI